MNNRPALIWFRNDLRLGDNPALSAAAEAGQPLICVYILDEGGDRRPLGGASLWWLHHSLAALEAALAAHNVPLLLLRGDPAVLIPRLAEQVDASAIHWNRRYGGPERALDAALMTRLKDAGRTVKSHNAALLNEPWEIKTGGGTPFKVFTPYWRAAVAKGAFAPPQPAPARLVAHPLPGSLGGLRLADLALLPTKPDWAGGMRQAWVPGEAGAQAALARFLDEALHRYADKRDVPGIEATSRLSPYLAFGDISPRQIAAATAFHAEANDEPAMGKNRAKFEAELGWREFAHHVLFDYPDMATRNLNPKFDAMPWRNNAGEIRAWQRGMTGYPIVDAGMRQLWQTGWMHNRVRMVVASFLIKHLGVDWRIGEEWFWDTLVDADPAANAFSWQWVAGCGFDAAPYYRIFNPILQGLKFDTKGDYVRHFVPELADLPDENLHALWEAPPHILRRAGVILGKTYPHPIVAHADGRDRAMSAYRALETPEG